MAEGMCVGGALLRGYDHAGVSVILGVAKRSIHAAWVSFQRGGSPLAANRPRLKSESDQLLAAHFADTIDLDT